MPHVFLFLLFSSAITYSSRHILIIDPPPEIDGLKLIWRVMKYSWKHKNPVRQSAFTYSEGPPTRLDLAKERYGGPFTTKQVEEVKSFWHLIQIPICHFFNTGYYSSVALGYQYVSCLKINGIKLKITDSLLLSNSTTLGDTVVVIGIPISQILILALCPKCIPSILHRIWIGLLFLLLSSISIAVLSFNITNNLPSLTDEAVGNVSTTTVCDHLWSQYTFIIPGLLTGLGLLFNLTSQLEFVLAQVPYNMQSIFIGATYSQYFFPYLNNTIGIVTPAGRHWQYYMALSCLELAIFVAFTIIKRRYRYRQCNNDSDINIRVEYRGSL